MLSDGAVAGPVQTHTLAGQWLKSQLYEHRPFRLSEIPGALEPPVQAGEEGPVDVLVAAAEDVAVPVAVEVGTAADVDTPDPELEAQIPNWSWLYGRQYCHNMTQN